MRNIYVITMWTGSGPARKWKSYEIPTLLPQGTGVEFVNAETKLKVQVIGNISIEEYESGKEEIETMRSEWVTLSPHAMNTPEARQAGSAHSGNVREQQEDSNEGKGEGEAKNKDKKGVHRLF